MHIQTPVVVDLLTLAQPRGWQNCHPPYVLWRYFLQYEELGFSPVRIPPEILSARGEVKMPAIVRHGAIQRLIFHLWGIRILLRFWLHLKIWIFSTSCCTFITVTWLVRVYIYVCMHMWRPQAITPSGWSWGFYVQRDRATPKTTVASALIASHK